MLKKKRRKLENGKEKNRKETEKQKKKEIDRKKNRKKNYNLPFYSIICELKQKLTFSFLYMIKISKFDQDKCLF